MDIASGKGTFSRIGAFALLVLGLAAANPASAITKGGEPDNGEHPGVGLMVLTANGLPISRCTGVLLSPTIFLTAGHCTYVDGPGGADEGARVWFEEDVDYVADYPWGGITAVEATAVHWHPLYDTSAFYLYDLGIVELEKPVNLPPEAYATLPTPAQLDQYARKRGLQDTTFTAVGYGLQAIRPTYTIGLRKRLKASLRLIDLIGVVGTPRGTSIALSNNPTTGGTCFGDSGGPIYLNDTNVVAAVTSFGINGNCVGTGFGYRVDKPFDIDWVNGFLD